MIIKGVNLVGISNSLYLSWGVEFWSNIDKWVKVSFPSNLIICFSENVINLFALSNSSFGVSKSELTLIILFEFSLSTLSFLIFVISLNVLSSSSECSFFKFSVFKLSLLLLFLFNILLSFFNIFFSSSFSLLIFSLILLLIISLCLILLFLFALFSWIWLLFISPKLYIGLSKTLFFFSFLFSILSLFKFWDTLLWFIFSFCLF